MRSLFGHCDTNAHGCAIAVRIRWGCLLWKIQVTELVLSGLCRRKSGKKRHININFFWPVGLGMTPVLSRGFHRVCPWDKSGENLGQTRVFSLFYTVEARFVPGTNPGTKGGTESLCEKSLCAFFAR